ncbi:glycosyltransferase family A protein [Mesorhizobium sp. DCY119]|uniref:glycosyltransferase family 2 protein n=1 Tax=Mesorhizobium sp. DCY119 TaxID=2108445 RepID=UPI000E7405A4|nr:glycosyltransferase family A protein [Mesorhizobium sp. DCY119]RJG40888.1 glycosyltransferase family 2 protein [Mesorhizobium sp. DCY119]
MKLSIVIRSYNEQAHIGKLMTGISQQTLQPFEVILVDSGSTDKTVEIALKMGARVVHIEKSEFTFGRALNVGCAAAQGDILVFASAHVYPEGRRWLENLIVPFADPRIALSYGKQRGGITNKYSEHRLFCKWFPRVSASPQTFYFCNNANCAIRRELWIENPYDETLTGLEDLAWAKRVMTLGWQIAYRADAGIVHIHDETWTNVRSRYRREAIAMKRIDPGQRLGLLEFARLLPEHIARDSYAAARDSVLHRKFFEIVLFRFNQLFGTWQGFRDRSDLSSELANRFYYPPRKNDPKAVDPINDEPIDYKLLTGDLTR